MPAPDHAMNERDSYALARKVIRVAMLAIKHQRRFSYRHASAEVVAPPSVIGRQSGRASRWYRVQDEASISLCAMMSTSHMQQKVEYIEASASKEFTIINIAGRDYIIAFTSAAKPPDNESCRAIAACSWPRFMRHEAIGAMPPK